VSSLALAIRYLTILPLPGSGHHPPDGLGRASAWFPVVGAGLGGLLVLTDHLTARVFPPWVSAALTVVVWKVLSGGVHLDGLADCLDGLAGRDREHRLAIMRDSRIGTFGAAGLALFLVLEVVALAEVPPPVRWRVLLAAAPIARAMPPLLARLFRPARSEGHGAAFAAGVSGGGAGLAVTAALLIAFAALGAAGIVAMLLAGLVAVAGAALLAHRLGGFTGDVLGGALEVAELVVVLTVLAWLGAQA
jgi:adenosylcobinamide-GDP ribazoletransferase